MIVIMMMVLFRSLLLSSSSTSPRRGGQYDGGLVPISIGRLLCLLAGIAIGFMSASFVATIIQEEPPNRSRTTSPLLLLRPTFPSSSATSRLLGEDDENINNNDGRDGSGWNTIHVYVGDDQSLRQEQLVRASAIPRDYYMSTRWFAQARQDELVAALLRYQRCGYFVDLAANDAVRISNTYALERDYDWHGLAIEPNPIYWNSLVHRRSRTIIVAAVVGGMQHDVRPFRFPKDKAPQGGLVFPAVVTARAASTTTTTAIPTKDRPYKNEDEIQMQPTVSLDEILDRYKAPKVIDYLSLDCEGAEALVLADFPFDRYKFNIMTIERPDRVLSKTLEKHGYRQLERLKQWGETLWAHETVLDRLDLMAVVRLDPHNYKYSEKI